MTYRLHGSGSGSWNFEKGFDMISIMDLHSSRLRGPILALLIASVQVLHATALPEAQISLAEVSVHLRFLASDELAGRLIGTAGHEVAARYIAEQWHAAGVEPAGNSADYFQPVPLERVFPAEDGSLQILGRKPALGRDLLILSGEELKLTAPFRFLGHGLPRDGLEPELYEDTQGAVILVQAGRPGEGRPNPSATRLKLRLAQEAGALALVEIYEDNAWQLAIRFLGRPRTRLRPDPASARGQIPLIAMRLPDPDLIGNLRALPEAAVELESSGVRREAVQASNLAGIIRGADPALREEFVVLMAHYDHLGTDPQAFGASPEDFIFNGARDNAMGVTALLAAARSLALRPPARSLLLLAITAEESGLLGSRYYVENPIVPLGQTVFALNSDGAGFSDTDLVTVLGLERTTAGQQLASGCRQAGLEAYLGPPEAQDFFDRSDNLNFARAGVPTVTFSPGFRRLEGPAFQHYHRPSDEVEEGFDYSYLLRFSRAFAASARALADHPERPRWVAGDPYESVAARPSRER